MMTAAASQSRVSAQADQIVGGYGDISATSKDAKSAAAFAITKQAAKSGKKLTLVKITKAEQQVVAGINYRVCMMVREGRRKAYSVTAVVYQNLKNRRSLSNWKKGECSDL
jgi:hypothetical protein